MRPDHGCPSSSPPQGVSGRDLVPRSRSNRVASSAAAGGAESRSSPERRSPPKAAPPEHACPAGVLHWLWGRGAAAAGVPQPSGPLCLLHTCVSCKSWQRSADRPESSTLPKCLLPQNLGREKTLTQMSSQTECPALSATPAELTFTLACVRAAEVHGGVHAYMSASDYMCVLAAV